jgi:methylmalonyl-CoA mutase
MKTAETQKTGQIMNKTNDILSLISSLFPPADEKAWRNAAESLLKGKSFEKALLTKTIESITLSPIYTETDTTDLPFIESLPGTYPYSRGATAAGYHARNWLIAQAVAAPEPVIANQLLREELDGGTQAINLQPDYPTLAGADADVADPTQIGRNGVSLNTVDDMTVLLNKIDVAKYPLYLHCGASNSNLLGLLVAFANKNAVPLSSIHGVVGADPVGALAEVGQLADSLDKLLDEIAEGMRFAERHQMRVRHLLVRSDIYVNAGADIVTELAATLATALFYLRNLQQRGFSVEQIARTIAFQTGTGNHFFMEIAKLRALRMLWGQILQTFEQNAGIGEMFIHATGTKWNKSFLDAHNNILRATTETLAAVLGGADSIANFPHDFLTDTSGTTLSRRIARNIQHIIREESHFDHVLDPVGGAWYLEKITDELAKKVWQKFQDIESNGGIIDVLETGDLQREIETTATNRMEMMARGKTSLIGVNRYANADETPATPTQERFDAAKRVQQLRQHKVKHPLPKINSFELPEIIKRFENGATIGQITELRYRDPEDHPRVYPIKEMRAAMPFEALRQRVANFQEQSTELPGILLLRYGSLRDYQPRCDFSKEFLAIAGLKALESRPVSTPEAALSEIRSHAPQMVIFCSADALYREFVETVSQHLKSTQQPPVIVLAGNPPDDIEKYFAAGVDRNIYLNCHSTQTLKWILEKLGIPA